MKNQKKRSEEISIVSLFSGCGGLDLGFEGGFPVLKSCLNPRIHASWFKNQTSNSSWVTLPKTRFKTIFSNDILPAAKSSWVPYFSKRNKETVFRAESIVDLVKRHQAGEKVFPKADIVIGGFPCQDFSVAGKRRGFNSHKAHNGSFLQNGDEATEENRGMLYIWMRRVIDIVRPKMFIAENVKGLISLADAKRIIERDFSAVGGEGYLVIDAKVLSAANYGVPQRRERVFFIGFRKDLLTKKALKALSSKVISPEFDPYPRPTHGEATNNCVLPYMTVGKALQDLLEPEKSSDLSQKAFSKAKWYGRHCQGQVEVDLNGLGPTIRAEHHGNIEFRRLSKTNGGKYLNELKSGDRERRLTVRECARIQTFPDDYEFIREHKNYKLTSSEGYKVIGNAVPPILGYHLATRLQELWPIIFKKGNK